MSANELFLHKMKALQSITQSRETERLLELAGILRLLLIDGSPLISMVNRELKEELVFVVGISAEQSIADSQRRVPGLLPSAAFSSILPMREKTGLTKDQFLKHSVLYVGHSNSTGSYYTVRDLISITANKLGGVHYDSPDRDSPAQASLRALNSFMSLYGSPVAFGVLAEIAIVVNEAVKPICDRLSGLSR